MAVAGAHTPLFTDLLEALRRRGFPIGVDHYVRVHSLLDRVGADCDPRQLRTLLCPVVATSAAQQEQFYTTFDQLYGTFVEPDGAREEQPDETAWPASDASALEPRAARPAPRLRSRIVALALVAAAAIAGVFTWRMQADRLPQAAPRDTVRVQTQPPAPAPTVPAPTARTEPPSRTTGSPSRSLPFVLLLLAPFAIFLADETRRYVRRRLVLRRERQDRPPFVWPIKLPAALNPFERSATIPAAARRLRRRELLEGVARIDVEASIAATIRSLGFPTIRYASGTKPPEYLVLIERSAPRDHQAALFADLSAALDRESVPLTRYYFDGDPRVCYRESGETGVPIAELRRRFPQHRLMVFGGTNGLLDPITGGLRTWVPSLMSWPHRAVLLATPPQRWGVREATLARHFLVLPASVASVAELRDLFDAQTSARADGTGSVATRPELDPAIWRSAPADIARALRTQLGEATYQWLCACALYPELQWDLTLYLGTVGAPGPELFTEENLHRLIRIPWFRDGLIPDDVRVVLLEDLRPELAREARSAIVAFLEKNPPPANAAATDSYQLNLAIQRLALSANDRQRRRDLVAAIDSTARHRMLGDQVVLRLLERLPDSRAALALPARLRRVLYRHGIPAFGWSTASRLSLAAAAMLVVLTIDPASARSAFESVTSERRAGRMTVVDSPPRLPDTLASTTATGSTPADSISTVVTGLVIGAGTAANPEELSVAAGDTIRLLARPLSAAGFLDARRVVTPILWTSLDPGVVTVTSRGVVAAIRPGRAALIATLGTLADTVSVRVQEANVSRIGFAPLSRTTLVVGESLGVAATAYGPRGEPMLDRIIALTSSDSTVATVSPAGLVTAVSPGRVRVLVSSGNVSAQSDEITIVRPAAPVAAPLTLAEASGLAREVEDAMTQLRVDRLEALMRESDAPTRQRLVDALGSSPAVRVSDVAVEGTDGAESTVSFNVTIQSLTARGATQRWSGAAQLVAARVERGWESRGLRLVRLTGGEVVTEPVMDAARFEREVVAPAVARYADSLHQRRVAYVGDLFLARTPQESRVRDELLQLVGRREAELSAAFTPPASGTRIAGDEAETRFRLRLAWRTWMGTSGRNTVTFRATFTRRDGVWEMTTCQIIGAPTLR